MLHNHASSAEKAACPVCNPDKTVPQLNDAYRAEVARPSNSNNDPFNCPKCGAHDYGLFAAAMVGCPHCMRSEIEQLKRERDAYFALLVAEGILIPDVPPAPETRACDCPEVCKVCGGRAKACALLGHRLEADRSIKWHECKANELKATDIQTRPLYACSRQGCPANHLSPYSVCVTQEPRRSESENV